MLHKLLLSSGLIMASTMSVAALESPYAGNPAPAAAGTFYLYNVESGLWLQDNCINRPNTAYGYDTFCANLWVDGLGFIITPNGDGTYTLDGGLNRASHFLNQDKLAMNEVASDWALEPAEGLSNAYRIKAPSGFYLGNDGQGNIAKVDNVDDGAVWQLVSADERIQYAKEIATKDNPVNLSWLIPAHSFAENDTHTNDWKSTNVENRDGIAYNKVRATYNKTPIEHSITISNIPNGTYRFNIHGYYREAGSNDAEFQAHLTDEQTYTNAEYFAGDKSGYFRTPGRLKRQQAGAGAGWKQVAVIDNWFIPNDYGSDSEACAADQEASLNGWVEVIVADNKLNLGVRKEGGRDGNRLVWDNFRLEYVSTSTGQVDLTPFVEKLNALLDNVKADLSILPNEVFADVIAEAEAVLAKGEDATPAEYTAATDALQNVYGNFNIDDARTFHAINELAVSEGINTTAGVAKFNASVNNDGVNSAIKDLRWARRRNAAPRHADNFSGAELTEGEFYLFNVGQRQFLNQGSDWHTHANLNYHGLHCTLEPAENGDFYINTNVNANQTYLNHGGYTDCPKEAFSFKPAENGAYYITYEADGQTKYLAYDPYAPTDAGWGDETTVSAKATDMEGNADAMWKLVSRTERMELLKNASKENPADATFMIENPGFDKQLSLDAWNADNIDIAANGGDNYNDRIIDCYGKASLSISQTIAGLPAGIYRLMVQGGYRHCSSTDQFINEYKDAAYLYGAEIQDVVAMAESEIPSEAETPIMNLMAEANKAPGEGTVYTDNEGKTLERPNSTAQTIDYFHTGLYNNEVTFEKKAADSNVEIGIYKDEMPYNGDMLQADNFRLLYLGKSETTSVSDVIPAPENSDTRIFNLQGIEITHPVSGGIYIQGGRKIRVK